MTVRRGYLHDIKDIALVRRTRRGTEVVRSHDRSIRINLGGNSENGQRSGSGLALPCEVTNGQKKIQRRLMHEVSKTWGGGGAQCLKGFGKKTRGNIVFHNLLHLKRS